MRRLKTGSVLGLLVLALGAASAAQAGGMVTGSLGNPNNVSVQTNIEGSKTIDSSSSVVSNQYINGANVAYGLSGGDALNVITSANAYGAAASAERTTPALNLENEVLSVVQ